MSPILLKTLNHYLGTAFTAAEAIEHVAALKVFPMPDRIALDDWRVHVPMHLLEAWQLLTDEERLAIYVMAESSTHPYELSAGPDGPGMN